jgi:DNA-binding LytR/AlgR family response regulator
MKKLRCLIVEDEPIARKIICEFIDQLDFLELSGEVETAIKAESFLQQHEADLLFLDIEMPRLSGLEYIKTRKVRPMVIITTAYPEYALEGYSLDVIDYLLKPIAFARFFKAAQKAKEYHDLNQIPSDNGSPQLLFVRSAKRIERINIEDILYVESTGNYVTIACKQKILTAYLTLKSLENQLPPKMFLKVNRSFIVNSAQIEYVENNHVKVGNKQISLSKQYSDKLMDLVRQNLLKR